MYLFAQDQLMIKKEEDSLLTPAIRLIYPWHLTRVDQLWTSVQNVITLSRQGRQTRIGSGHPKEPFINKMCYSQKSLIPHNLTHLPVQHWGLPLSDLVNVLQPSFALIDLLGDVPHDCKCCCHIAVITVGGNIKTHRLLIYIELIKHGLDMSHSKDTIWPN